MFRQQTIRILGFILALVLVTACSNREIYNTIQTNQKHQCRNLPPAAYDECINTYSESYDEYQKKRKQALEKK